MMRVNVNAAEVPIRENRLGEVANYRGTAEELCDICRGGNSCYREASFMQTADCASQRSLIQVSAIRDAAIINHGPIGCAADFAVWSDSYRAGLTMRGFSACNIRAVSSNVGERETIYGGTEILAETIDEVYLRFKPKAIFVMASCASGIIGDDIEGVLDQKQAEWNIPLVGVYCEGFKSRVWSSGFDAAFHGIMRKIVKPPLKKQPDLINIINFSGRHVFTPLLAKIGLRAEYVVPYTTVEKLEQLSEAAATTHICETLGTYLCHALEEIYGVPEVKSPPPFGLAWSDCWLREIGRITGKEDAVEALIKEERASIAAELAEVREKLQGKTVYVFSGDAYAHNMINVARDLGLEVIGVTTYHHDPVFDNPDAELRSLDQVVERGDVPNFSVFTKQPYQAINILRRLKPDMIIFRHPDMAVLGAKLGIPSFYVAGDANAYALYRGVIAIG
ncbi:MAG: nitrogenase, partial [Peptococcaceae bacterium]|nr:nitrogenase [Peptococcaceae bacterium]